jgi:DNA repair protein RadA/Sms
VIGEVGLGGEIRHVHQVEQRAREAIRLGYRTLIVPSAGAGAAIKGAEVVPVGTISQALGQVLEGR